jgi:hypothetical protein
VRAVPSGDYFSKGGQKSSTPVSPKNMSPINAQAALIRGAVRKVRALFYSLTWSTFGVNVAKPVVEALINAHARVCP